MLDGPYLISGVLVRFQCGSQWWLCVLPVVGIGQFLLSTIDVEAGWKAGVAVTVITPEEPMWMSGYAARDHVAEGQLTDLWAKALLLEDESGQRVVAVTLDLVGIDRQTSLVIREELERRYRLDRSRVSLLCSHTHSGPVVGRNLLTMYGLAPEHEAQVREYTRRLENQLVELVGRAIDDLAPAEVFRGLGRAEFAVNRRNNREPDVPLLREQGLLVGPVDHDVPVLVVRNEVGHLKALLVGYACHATTLSGYEWCGDYPGYAQIRLEERHPGCVALFWAGCGADQNPLPRRTVELAEDYGLQLADAVDSVLTESLIPLAPSLSTAYSEIELPLAEIPTRERVEEMSRSSNVYESRRGEHLLNVLEEQGVIPSVYPYPVQTWRLGDVIFTHLGGEVVVDFALRIKGDHDPARVWVAGYANDVMAYIPSLRVLREGGYEGGGAMVYYGLPSPWDENVEELIIREVEQQAAEVQ